MKLKLLAAAIWVCFETQCKSSCYVIIVLYVPDRAGRRRGATQSWSRGALLCWHSCTSTRRTDVASRTFISSTTTRARPPPPPPPPPPPRRPTPPRAPTRRPPPPTAPTAAPTAAPTTAPLRACPLSPTTTSILTSRKLVYSTIFCLHITDMYVVRLWIYLVARRQ